MSCIIEDLFNQIDFPDELLLLGSGESRTPQEFLSLPSVRFNSRTFAKEEFKNTPVFSHLINRAGFLRRKAIKFRKNNNYFIMRMHRKWDSPPIYDAKNNFYNISHANHSMLNNFGEWFYDKKIAMATIKKRPTTGFFACAFLLYGYSKSYYISGFDGYRSAVHSQYRVNGVTHDYNLEYEYMLEAIDIARSQGKKVYLAQDF